MLPNSTVRFVKYAKTFSNCSENYYLNKNKSMLSQLCLVPPVAEQQRSKLVDGWCQVQTLVSLVDQAFRNFSWFFSKTRENTGQEPLKRLPTEGTSPLGPGLTRGQLALNLQPTNPVMPFNLRPEQKWARFSFWFLNF